MKIYAHRGCSGKYPENTMLAFFKAAESGCDGIELDVQLTKDGQVVVIHDEAVDRTTDGSGLVKDFMLADLKRLDAGRIKGGSCGILPVPTFDEYCAWANKQDLVTNVEIKTGVYYYENIEEKTLEIIEKYHLEDRVLISSFNHSSLERFRTLAPDIPRGALIGPDGLGNAGFYCARYGFGFFHPYVKTLSKADVDGCHDWGIGVNVWTVNGLEEVANAYEWGCDGVITNFPEVLRGLALGEKR